jgi:YHS domain-containing protein/thiol-disulfide isomerase/thioredoxin
MRFALCGPRAGVMVVALVGSFVASAAQARADAWRKDFESAEAEAKETGRPMLVHFYADWCGPCMLMEQTVLRDPVLEKQLRTGFVAVKINSDRRPDLRDRFHVTKLPTDIFLDPRGNMLRRTSGEHSRTEYLGMVAEIDAMCARTRSTHMVSQTKPHLKEFSTDTESPLPLGPTPPPVAPDPARALPQVESEPLSPAISAKQGWELKRPRSSQRQRISLGLRGFSPVALSSRREWILGGQEFAAEYQGIVYFLATSDELRLFKERPERFAPQILGCDPVILDIADRAVPGDVRYAAYFDGELYLFISDKSRQLFKNDPHRFVRARHAQNIDELKRKHLESR